MMTPAETTRQLPWATSDTSEVNEDALKALETYKKRDPSKGSPRYVDSPASLSPP